MKAALFAFVTLVFAFHARIAVANNNLFLPGDAFFPTTITAEKLSELQAGVPAEKVFQYSNLGGYEGAFCGYAGYSRAKFAAMDQPFIANLALAYQDVRKLEPKELRETTEEGKTIQTETNGMRVLFYPRAFSFMQHKLGLQYNERWVEEAMKFGHQRRHLRLCELIDDKDAVMESWRDATEVGSFDAVLPNVKLTEGRPISDPIIFKGPVKAIVLSHHTLKEYFNASGEGDYRALRIVDSDGMQKYEWYEFKWQPVIEDK